jgi:hypothetical protein
VSCAITCWLVPVNCAVKYVVLCCAAPCHAVLPLAGVPPHELHLWHPGHMQGDTPHCSHQVSSTSQASSTGYKHRLPQRSAKRMRGRACVKMPLRLSCPGAYDSSRSMLYWQKSTAIVLHQPLLDRLTQQQTLTHQPSRVCCVHADIVMCVHCAPLCPCTCAACVQAPVC